MFIVSQGLWKWIYNAKENLSFLVKAVVEFRIGEENFIGLGISKLKNTSHHICICYIFFNEDIFFNGRVFSI